MISYEPIEARTDAVSKKRTFGTSSANFNRFARSSGYSVSTVSLVGAPTSFAVLLITPMRMRPM